MGFYTISLAVVGDVCFATGLFRLFIGLRRQGTDMKHSTFGLFALAYSGAVLAALFLATTRSSLKYLTFSSRMRA